MERLATQLFPSPQEAIEEIVAFRIRERMTLVGFVQFLHEQNLRGFSTAAWARWKKHPGTSAQTLAVALRDYEKGFTID